MLSQEEFINKLFNNELSDFVNYMENKYQKLLKEHSKEINKVELDMNEFTKGNYPNYVGFEKYVYSLYDDLQNDKSISTDYNLQFINDYMPQHDLSYFNYIVYHKLYVYFEHLKFSSATAEDKLWIQLFYSTIIKKYTELIFNARIYNYLNDSKFPEDIHNFSGDFKAKFYSSFANNNHDDAIRCLEHCEDLDKGEYEYLNALVYFKEENYQKALEYFNKIDNTCIDYKNSIMYKMQIYARIDTNKLFELLNENINNLAKFEVDSLILENILYLEFNNLQKEEYADIYKEIIRHCKNNTNEILDNIDLLLIVFFDVLFDIYDQLITLSINLGDIQNGKKIVENIRFVVELLNIERFKFIIDENSLNIDLMIDKLTNYYNKYNNIHILEKFAKFLYKHQYIKYFCNFINQHISLFEEMSKRDKKYLNYICEVYSEEKIRNNVDENVKRIYNFAYNENKSCENKLLIEKLSNEGIIAYKAAEFYYDLSKQIDYGWKDAGMLSLSYFRIIELELNKKILQKITSDNLSIIKKYYYNYINNYNISEKDKEIYKKKWHFIFEKKENNNYMLGQIYLYFKNLSNIDDNTSDELAKFLYSKTKEIVSEESLKSSFFTDMISNEIRNKYRNPPAHTQYLKYDIAKECREYVINQLNKLFDVLV